MLSSLQLTLLSAGCLLTSIMCKPLAVPSLTIGTVAGFCAQKQWEYEQEYEIPIRRLRQAAAINWQEEVIGYESFESSYQLELEHNSRISEHELLMALNGSISLPPAPPTPVKSAAVAVNPGLPAMASLANQGVITTEGELEAQHGDSSVLFNKFLKQPHNWVCGKTNGGKTFLLLRLVKDWIEENPDGRVYILDRNFGKPDRVTGEVFDWNGLPQSIIYSKDDQIVTVLNKLRSELDATIDGFDQFARKMTDVRPELKKTLIVCTEWNALVDNTKLTNDPKSSPAVESIRPILQQGNGYKFKVVLDGQNIAVGESGISEALREQISICLVGSTTCDMGVIGELGGTKKQKEEIVQECSALRKAGKRACVIQLGEGEPEVGVVPEMPWLRNFRFDTGTIPQVEPVQPSNDSSDDPLRQGLEVIFALLPENPTDKDIIKAYEQASRSPAPHDLTERNILIKYIRDCFNGKG